VANSVKRVDIDQGSTMLKHMRTEVCVKKITGLAVLVAIPLLFCTSLDQPVLISPSDGQELLTANPEFSWNAVPDARSYLFQVSADESFDNVIDTLIYSDTTFILGDTLDLARTYYWRITARTLQGDESDPSEVWSFSVKEGITIHSPGTSDSTANPFFSWSPFTGSDSYQLQVSRYADFRGLFFDTTLADTSFSFPVELEPRTLFWQLRAFHTGTPVTPWSRVRRLVTYRLSESYFPMHPEYGATFEVITGEGTYDILTGEWDTTDWEISNSEIGFDSTYEDEGDLFRVFTDTFWDIGFELTTRHDSLFSPYYFMGKLYPDTSVDPSFLIWSDTTYSVQWLEDTLRIYRQSPLSDSGTAYYKHIQILRLPGKGVVEQYYRMEYIKGGNLHSWEIKLMQLEP
jgi:hypothetical protein